MSSSCWLNVRASVSFKFIGLSFSVLYFDSLTRSFIHSFTPSFIRSFIPSFIHSFIHSFITAFRLLFHTLSVRILILLSDHSLFFLLSFFSNIMYVVFQHVPIFFFNFLLLTHSLFLPLSFVFYFILCLPRALSHS